MNNVGMNNNSISLVKTGTTSNYQNYKLKNPEGTVDLSVPLNEKDKFERSYHDTLKYGDLYLKDLQENKTKRKVKSYATIIGSTAATVGAAVAPFKLLRKMSAWGKTAIAIPATILTFITSVLVSNKIMLSGKYQNEFEKSVIDFTRMGRKYATGFEPNANIAQNKIH